MIKISIKELMKASPSLAPSNKPHGNKDFDIKESLFACSTSNRKTVIEKTVFKMSNDYIFCKEALENNFFDDFLASTKRKGNSMKFSSLMSKEYEWSIETVIIFWSLMICHRYFNWTEISSVKGGRKVTIDSVLTCVMGNREIIERNVEIGTAYPFTKIMLVDYPYNEMSRALEEVEEKVKRVAEFMIKEGKERRIKWYDFLETDLFFKVFNTARASNYENPLVDYLKQQNSREEPENTVIMGRINQIFYPRVDSDFKFESLKKINKKYREEVMLDSTELQDGIDCLENIKGQYYNWNTEKLIKLRKILNSIKKI